ncbi:MAG: type II toxin-antitoxin system prevent-host-death family antitoxin [Truepera sp.]|jgi:prevent-host-death family protein|nr:type II toxin-antitoxin system prevent-host-death family antitoxin [Truepera sp.]
MTTIGVTELRAQLKGVLERVKQGEEFTITQNDRVVAALVHPSRLELRITTPSTAAAEELVAALAHARQDLPERGQGIEPARAEAMVEELRAERDSWD